MNNVIIVGSGAAGLCSAIEAVKNGSKVAIITKKLYTNSTYQWQSDGGCTWKTHAFNVAISEHDSVEKHIEDTIVGGAYANNPDLVQLLCSESINLIDWLTDLGVSFSSNNEKILLKPFGGCGVSRAVYIEDRLGFYIQKALLKAVHHFIELERITLFEGVRFLNLTKSESTDEINGVSFMNLSTFEVFELEGSRIILTDGGGASMYSPNALSTDKTCDGIVAAFNSGAELIDMEFVQFHPTGLITDISPFTGSLVEEAVRFIGATLLNKNGERFMKFYDPKNESATRDIVARAIFTEVASGRGFNDQYINLDISQCHQIIMEEYPALFERLMQAGIDVATTHMIPVLPTAHFLMGGIKVNQEMQSTLSNVLAAGESCGGIHGANRLGGNGLSEALVTGRIAGRTAATANSSIPSKFNVIKKKSVYIQPNVNKSKRQYLPENLLMKLQITMYQFAGLIKSRESLIKAKKEIGSLQNKLNNSVVIPNGSRASKHYSDYLDVKNLLLAADIIVEASLRREESRGSHFRSDFPNQDKTYAYNAVKMGSDKFNIWSTKSYLKT